jgi:hypothetical protein
MKPVPLDSRFCDLSRKNILQNSSIYLGPVSFNSYLNCNFINARASPSHVGPIVGGLFPKEEKVEQFPKFYKHQVLRSVTLSNASPGAYSSYRTNMTCFVYFIAFDVLYIMYLVFLDDGDRLYGSNLLYTILV